MSVRFLYNFTNWLRLDISATQGVEFINQKLSPQFYFYSFPWYKYDSLNQ